MRNTSGRGHALCMPCEMALYHICCASGTANKPYRLFQFWLGSEGIDALQLTSEMWGKGQSECSVRNSE